MIDFQTATRRENLELLLADASRASFALASDLTLRANDAVVTPATRDELLAKVRAGEHVELELDVYAFEQLAGERNRKNVRFRDGAMQALGRSGVGKPVLRDHAQDNMLAVAGKVISSKAEKTGEGAYAVTQTWRLMAPWAVELALRGLLSTVSIGWRATGPVLCSACNATVFSQCYHCPGDRLAEKIGDDGVKRNVRDRAGSIVVEWIYTDAELVETSVVSVPAVPSAHIEGIRAALSAHGGMSPPEEAQIMNPKLLALLGLAATVGESEVLSAVEALRVDATEGKIAARELAAANKELEILNHEKRQSEADTFISDALLSGRIAKGDEDHWREFFTLSSDRARASMAKRAEGSATPVGQRRQSADLVGESQLEAPVGGAIAEAHRVLKANHIDPAAAARFATKFGVVGDPMKAIAKHCAGQEVT